jgi:microtubule-associated protein-like 6
MGKASATSVKAVGRSHSKQLVASGGTSGMVGLFRYPCGEGAVSKQMRGHASHISSLTFSADDRYLISSGGRDRALLVWSVLP